MNPAVVAKIVPAWMGVWLIRLGAYLQAVDRIVEREKKIYVERVVETPVEKIVEVPIPPTIGTLWEAWKEKMKGWVP